MDKLEICDDTTTYFPTGIVTNNLERGCTKIKHRCMPFPAPPPVPPHPANSYRATSQDATRNSEKSHAQHHSARIIL